MRLPPLYEDLNFLSPMSEQRAAVLAAWLAAGLQDGGTVIDVGCGWGELLLRVTADAPLSEGVGVDINPAFLIEAQRRATERGLGKRVSFLQGEGSISGPDQVDALIAIGATQVWGPPTTAGQPLDYDAALTAIRERVRRGGRVVFGDGIWSQPPTPEATAPLAGRDDELVSLATLTERAVVHGFGVAGVREASLEEWDDFESRYSAGYTHWLTQHDTNHADAEAVREKARSQRQGYLGGYRKTLGHAFLQLVAL